MMQVKTYLEKSSIEGAGIGLFANEFIPKGTVVWKFVDILDKIYTEEEYQAMPTLYKDFLDIYSFMYMGKYILCVDNARFFNHSDTPNCMSYGNSENVMGYTIAKDDINVGDELTDNYADFGFLDSDKNYNDLNLFSK